MGKPHLHGTTFIVRAILRTFATCPIGAVAP